MKTLLTAIIMLGVFGTLGNASELSGYLAAEGTLFFNDALFPEQGKHGASFSFQPEYYTI